MEKTSRARVIDAVSHREPDKVPLDIGSHDCSGIALKCYAGVRDLLGLPQKEASVHSMTQQTASIDDDFADKAEIDVRSVTCGDFEQPYNSEELHIEGTYETIRDVYGVTWKKPIDGGHYFDMTAHPFAGNPSLKALEDYCWPDMSEPSLSAHMKEAADRITYQERRAYCLERQYGGVWETALWLCGFEEMFCNMMLEKEFSHRLMEISTQMRMAYWRNAVNEVEDTLVIVSEADDLATQNSLMVSKELYMEMVHPYHKKLFRFIRGLTEKPLMINYHSCGAVREMIPILIEEGIDIINPVQVSASGMDLAELKREFGKDLTFWGAAVDSQHTLQEGTKEEIFDEVKAHIDILAPGGGYVFAPIHNIQANVPPKNVCYMLEAFYKYR